ncbi:MAG: LytTR family transcriptional regulator [Spirosomaceae bacterium]|nr:LytTR family transcriptional regulator [Spirosomataceae bacterium]
MITPKILGQISQESNILYIKADQNYSVFHLKNGTTYVSGYTLKFHSGFLDIDNFIRPNRSILVHKSYVRGIKEKGKTNYATLKNGRDVLISRRRVKTIQQELSPTNS